MVSRGEPERLFARAKDAHPIEPKAKREVVLKDRQPGVRRVLSRVDAGTSAARLNADLKVVDKVGSCVESTFNLCQSQFKEHMQEHIREKLETMKLELGWTPERIDTLNRLWDARLVRCSVGAWLDMKDSKNLLALAVEKVNASKGGKGDVVTNLVFEIKRLLKNKDVHDQQSLHSIKEAVHKATSTSQSSDLGGGGFVEVIGAYLGVNAFPHETLNESELREIRARIASGHTFHFGEDGRKWLDFMAACLLDS